MVNTSSAQDKHKVVLYQPAFASVVLAEGANGPSLYQKIITQYKLRKECRALTSGIPNNSSRLVSKNSDGSLVSGTDGFNIYCSQVSNVYFCSAVCEITREITLP